MSRLLLVRHADSLPPTVDGPDEHVRPLSARGLEQAEQLAPSLAARRPGRLLSSPYLRARQTIAPAAAALGLPVEQRAELGEWVSGLRPTPDWRAEYRYFWEHPDERSEDGESHDQLERRAVAALLAVAADAADTLTVIASHGTWISRALHGLGAPVDADFWFQMPMPAVYEVVFAAGSVPSITGPGLAGRRPC